MPTRPTRPTCPTCQAEIPPASMNLAEGVALCPSCSALHRLSAIVGAETVDIPEPLPTAAPDPIPGTSYRDDGLLITITASARSLAASIILLFMSVFWNGITYLFVAAAWTRILIELGITPIWIGATPPTSGPLADALKMPLALAIIMAVFMLPFMLIGFGMLLAMLYSMFGHLEAVIADHEAWVREAIGPWGRRKRFDPRTVASIGTKVEMTRDSSGDVHISRRLTIEHAGKRIKCAGSLTEDRRRYLERAMRYAILSRRPPS